MAVPSSLARRYAPFLILAGVQVLLVAVVPSTGGPNDSGTVAAGPGAYNSDDYIPGENINPDGSPIDPNAPGGAAGGPGGSGGPGGTTAGSAGGGGGGGGGGAGGGGGRGGLSADKSKCAKDGIRQQDVTITSPPCVPRWTGPNGGATYQGVTEKTVTILHYRTEADPQVDAILQTQGLASSPAEEKHARDAFAKFFEKHYEFYGRTINWVFHQGTCKTTPPDLPCYRREARELNDKYKPFSVFWTNSTVQAEFFDQWSELGVVNIGGWHFHNDFFTENRPYHWDVFMDGTRTTQNLAEYWCKKLQGKNAKFAGDPTIQTKRRKLGVITQNYEYTRRNAVDFINAVRGGMCGVPGDAAEPFYTESDITKAQFAADAAMEHLKREQVTTVVFLSDPIGPRFFTNSATAKGYYPEHLLSGAGLIDYDVLGRLYEQSQWVNAFGPGHLAEPIPFNQTDAARAAADVGVNNVYSGANLLFAYMHLAVLQVQMAGPNLNPTNVERGVHALPPGGGWERTKNPASVLIKFGPGDYTAIQDSRHTWWDPQATSKIDGKTGAYRAVQGGRRWEIGTWGPEELVKQ